MYARIFIQNEACHRCPCHGHADLVQAGHASDDLSRDRPGQCQLQWQCLGPVPNFRAEIALGAEKHSYRGVRYIYIHRAAFSRITFHALRSWDFLYVSRNSKKSFLLNTCTWDCTGRLHLRLQLSLEFRWWSAGLQLGWHTQAHALSRSWKCMIIPCFILLFTKQNL